MNQNRTKCLTDSVQIGTKDGQRNVSSTAKQEFINKNELSKSVNSPLPTDVANNIRSAHVELGSQAPSKQTETKDSYKNHGQTCKFSLGPERIEFFKQSHISIGSAQNRVIQNETTHKRMNQTYSGNFQSNPNSCSAFQIRFGKTQIGSKNAPNAFVSTTQTLQKWIQPKFTA